MTSWTGRPSAGGSSGLVRALRAVGRGVYRALQVVGCAWWGIPASVLLPEPAAESTSARLLAGDSPPPGHPERLCPELAATAQELALWRLIGDVTLPDAE